jgi:PAS domain S-box-containing protein
VPPKPPIPANEEARLKTLLAYHLLDSMPEQAFDDLTLIASEICGTPIALVTLLDRERQWFKSRVGLEAPETPRDVAFCAHAIMQEDVFIVSDAFEDPRFADNPLSTDDPHVRFYAGMPLITPTGHALGTLCVIDHIPRTLTEKQIQALRGLARQVMTQIEMRQIVERLEFALEQRNTAVEEAHTNAAFINAILENLPNMVFVKDATTLRFVQLNQAGEHLLGYAREQLIGKTDFDLFTHAQAEHFTMLDRAALASDAVTTIAEETITTNTGEQRILTTKKIAIRDEHGQPQFLLGISEDITDLQQSKATQLETQEQIIQIQQQALAELATPLIPLNDHVVLMPLIGALDSLRAQQAVTRLLNGVAEHRAGVVFLDITGVPIVDTQVAAALIHAAKAIQLLGASMILTGIRPEIAQTLIGLGIDMHTIVTRSTLQSGIAYAMGKR